MSQHFQHHVNSSPDGNPVDLTDPLPPPPPVDLTDPSPSPHVELVTDPVDSVIDHNPPPADSADVALIKLKMRKANAVAVKKYRANKRKEFEGLEKSEDTKEVAKASNVKEEEKKYDKKKGLKRVTLTMRLRKARKIVDLRQAI